MKKLITLSTFLLIGTSSWLRSMERDNQPMPILYLKNATQDKIDVVRQHLNQEPLLQTYDKDSKTVELGNPATLKLLTIDRYGRYKSRASLHGLAGTYWPLENTVTKVHEALRKYGAVPLLAKVGYGYFGATLGYVVTVEPYRPENREDRQKPKLHCVWDNFEQVKNASNQGKKIEARYFLNLNENATADEIERAYVFLRSKWLPDLKNQNHEISDRAAYCLRFLDAAYWSLIKGGETTKDFEDMIKAEEDTANLFLCPLK